MQMGGRATQPALATLPGSSTAVRKHTPCTLLPGSPPTCSICFGVGISTQMAALPRVGQAAKYNALNSCVCLRLHRRRRRGGLRGMQDEGRESGQAAGSVGPW